MTVMHAPSLIRGILSSGEALPEDAELLEAFLRRKDAEAFAAIVHRYGSLVLRVCRRVLGNQHDAEDAFQASFLVFYRKAGTLRQSASLGSFLHGIAYRTAQNLLRLRQRRHVHESASGWNRTTTHDQHGWHEVQAVLDREIQLLPALYRDVFIHCCLERQSRADVARLLGVKEGTLSSRLMQAKKMLQERLTAQGISLATLLGAISLTESSASHALLKQVIQGIAGTASLPAHVITLARPVMSERLLLTPLVAISLVIALIVGVAVAIQPDAKVLASPESIVQPIPIPQAGPLLSASGTVVTPDGKPLAGAMVYLREWSDMRATLAPSEIPPGQDLIAKTTSDAAGHFAFKNVQAPATPTLHMRNSSPYEVLVMAKGYAPVWQHLTPPLQKQPLLMQLATAGTIQGVIKNARGEPAVGAVVRLLDVGPMRRSFRFGIHRFENNTLVLKDSAVSCEATVDRQGKFILSDLPRDTCVSLEVDYEGWSEPPLYVAVSNEPQPDLSQVSYTGTQQRLEHQQVLISPLNMTLSARHQIRGTVVADDTGKPVSQANIRVSTSSGKQQFLTTDAHGAFQINATLDGKVIVSAWGGKQHPSLLYKGVKLNDVNTNPLVVRLDRGQRISGKVIDADTRQPVKNAKLTLSVPKPGNTSRWAHTSDEQGNFEIYAPVGKVQLEADSLTGKGKSTPLELTREKPVTGVTLLRNLDRQQSQIEGHILDPQGNVVEGASIDLANARQPSELHNETHSDKNGWFSIALKHLTSSRAEAQLMVIHEQRQLGCYYSISEDEDMKNVEIRLAPLATLSGQVLDPQGKPIRNANVTLYLQSTRRMMINGVMTHTTSIGVFEHLATVTDADGKYELKNIIASAECRYYAKITCKGYTSISTKPVNLSPGEHATSGEVRLFPTTHGIAGIVVDAKGKPVSNVMLTPSPETAGDAFVGSLSGYQVTKADGKFSFSQLPQGRVRLSWEIIKPGEHSGEHYFNQRHIIVEAGKMDVRLVIE